MDLLLFFALPIATIILAIVLQKILRCPVLVAATFFAIYLILAFTAFDTSFLIYAIVYTILAFITASITQLIENDGFTIRNLRANNINSNTINTDTLSANEVISDNNNSSSNSCGCNQNRSCYSYNRSWYGK